MTKPKLTPSSVNGATALPMPARFWVKADLSGDCWLWMAQINEDGYGVFSRSRRKPERAHRVAYELAVGPIPAGMQLDHLCRNRACVNPAHLEVVTNRENIMRGESPTIRVVRDGRCLRGHPRTPATVYILPNGKTRCRVCNTEWARRHRIARAYQEAGETT